jgi:hypothetical protein
VVALVRGLDEGQLEAPLPACPGWCAADVVAHMTAISEDVLESR